MLRIPIIVRKLLFSLRAEAKKRAIRLTATKQGGRLVIGAGAIQYEGWTTTDREVLDVLKKRDWAFLFMTNSLDVILAEHVWEHLTKEDALIAAGNCFRFIKPGGYLRVAVPDGFHPDPIYLEQVKPGGGGAGAHDHKVLYTYDSFRQVFTSVGFSVVLYEYFDENGRFREKVWSAADGMIRRSRRFDERNRGSELRYTSIILDAIKPLV